MQERLSRETASVVDLGLSLTLLNETGDLAGVQDDAATSLAEAPLSDNEVARVRCRREPGVDQQQMRQEEEPTATRNAIGLAGRLVSV